MRTPVANMCPENGASLESLSTFETDEALRGRNSHDLPKVNGRV